MKTQFPKFRNRGLGERTAEKIVVNARKCKNMKFELGIDIWEKSLKALTTNSSEFDNLIGNGFKLGTITEIFRRFKTGKI
ncbi:MAG: hypothetical protein EU540_04165 [Promethearchaeota archaeon]|nr:MAG: hypothetical protein EU540_04165 [Candidatus Lokiarchaeota archaeon]